jgi:hypothetical protein
MLPRERMLATLDFKPVDVVPLQIFAAAGGLYEHGQKLVDLTKQCGHDFGDFVNLAPPGAPGPEDFDKDGRYYAIRTDDWGTKWEYRIFGIWGHPIALPLADMSVVDSYRIPAVPPSSGPEFDKARAGVQEHVKRWFYLGGGGSIFEKLCSIRGFEDTIVDITLDTPEINRMADRLVEYNLAVTERSLALGADAVAIGDDFGTQAALIFPPKVWRKFFRPRYQAMFAPVHRAGKKVFFHSCGQINDMLDEFAELGVAAIWPQLPVFDLPDLARRSKELKLAIQLHPDRGELMQRRTPGEVRDYVLRLVDTFGTVGGGSWLYLEVDPGFPWRNVEALFDVAMELRAAK